MAPKSEPPPRIFRCSCLFCGKMLRDFSVLNIHMRKHTEERPYNCSTCSKDFKSKTCVEKHKRLVHLDVRNFKCDICGKCFKQKHHFDNHQVTHSKDKSFKCDQCGRLLTRWSALQRHKKGHMGKKQYACNLCEKRFTTKSNLGRHEKTAHSDVTPQKRAPHEANGSLTNAISAPNHLVEKKIGSVVTSRSTCRKSHTGAISAAESLSGRPTQLDLHLRRHREEKMEQCTFCNKKFVHKSTLRHHLRNHSESNLAIRLDRAEDHVQKRTGENPFICKFCGKEFGEKKFRDWHLTSYHDA